MRSAQESAEKYVNRAGSASQDYVEGATNTNKDQAAAAIAAEPLYQQALTESFARKSFSKGLQKSGKSKWAEGVRVKGSARYAGGVAAAAGDYATNSGKYDSARNAASSLPRGPKGSEQNFNRAKTVGLALRKLKIGA